MEFSNNKRLVVNTAILYGKLIVSVIISFLVSRLVLQALGASDYGLYNVIGGFVALLNTLGTTMIATSYRFLAVEIGKGEKGNPNKVYNTVLVIHIILAIFLILIGESLGVYYITHYLNVFPDRIPDALFVLHLSLLTSTFVVLSIPANGLIIARERFFFTSLIEIISAFMKLGLIFLLMNMEGNRLRLYVLFIAIVQLVTPIAYQLYCYFKEKRITEWCFNKVKDDYYTIVKFASGVLLGALACMARVQGAAMIINIFFGTIVNAAFALATQVWAASDLFTNSLRQAAAPQIMKSLASGEERDSLQLVYLISRYSFLLMLLPAVPLIVGIDGVLLFWLGNAPMYTKEFVIFLLIYGLVNSLCAGFDAEIQATGKIWKNQIGFSLINLLLLPLMFFMYKSGMPPYSNTMVMVILSLAVVIFQIFIMCELTSFNIKRYILECASPGVCSAMLAFIPFILFQVIFGDVFASSIWISLIAFMWTVFSVFFIGMRLEDRQLIILKVKAHL